MTKSSFVVLIQKVLPNRYSLEYGCHPLKLVQLLNIHIFEVIKLTFTVLIAVIRLQPAVVFFYPLIEVPCDPRQVNRNLLTYRQSGHSYLQFNSISHGIALTLH